MIKTLKRIEPLQLGKISGALYGLMSLIFVPFFLLAALIPGFMSQNGDGPSAAISIAIALAMAVFFPIIYAVMGFILGVISAFFYNVIAKRIGGIQVDVE